MAARVTRRLPGFKFEARSPQLDEKLPRMDIAVFVGFAQSGPLHTPVAIEGSDQYADIFGEDAPLAWDDERCRQVYANLGPTVRCFFRNGGRRCWVIRVASDDADYNYFTVPGLAMAQFGGDGNLALVRPALLRATSEGSWSDGVKVSSALLSQPFEVTSVRRAPVQADSELVESLVIDVRASEGDLAAGDLLQLSFSDGTAAMVSVGSAVEESDSPPSDRSHVAVTGNRELWLKPLPTQSDASSPTVGSALLYARVKSSELPENAPPDFEIDEIDARINWPTGSRVQAEVFLRTSNDNAPAPGSMVVISTDDQTAVIHVVDSGPGETPDFGRAVRLLGDGLLVMPDKLALPFGLPIANKLSFELWTRSGDEEAVRLSELGFNSPHERFWGALPTDQQYYKQLTDNQLAGAAEPGIVELAFDKQRAELGQQGKILKFPLAGVESEGALYFPLGMTALPVEYAGRTQADGLALERDGLADLDANLFLDPELIEPGTTSFAEQADFLRYLSPQPRRLRGVHTAYGIEEATIVAVPDAIHRGWSKRGELPEPVAKPSAPIARPEWWHFRACKSNQEIPLTAAPERGRFLSCDAEAPTPPSLAMVSPPDGTGTFTLEWFSLPPSSSSDPVFFLEQATQPNFIDATTIYTGGKNSLVIFGQAPGEYYYRIRVEYSHNTSDWSSGVGVRVSPSRGYRLDPVADYSPTTLLAVQRALLRMCGSRGDLFAVLSLPEHYREDAAMQHVKTLKSASALPIEVDTSFNIEIPGGVERRNMQAVSLPLSSGEALDFSHCAVYHPWLIGGEERDRFSAVPADGAACGVIAARAISRGAWIAPANEALRGPVALSPAISSERWADLQESQINVIRQDPRGFLVLSADTLSDDDDLRPIGVRRLLSLLRRLALRLGASYVFEPNDFSFRRLVQRGFEAMLGEMFVRGAFAGPTPQTSFQVVTGDSLNTPQSVDQGKFIVEMRVAPSLPMTFMTIRLVQTGDRTSVLETR